VPVVHAGRHRGPGQGRYGAPPPRHPAAQFGGIRLRRAFVAVIGTLAAADLALSGLLLHEPGGDDGGTPVAATPLPAISIPPPPTAAAPQRTLSPERALRRAAKVRPPVLLGPQDLALALTGYCRATVAGAVGASAHAAGWTCDRPPAAASAVDMDAACRGLYGPHAWSAMLDDTDQQSWRCYRDPA
jgi:hypothetical protein